MKSKEPAKWKIETVKQFKEFLKGKKVVGVVDLLNLPSPQFQELKKKLRGRAEVRVARTSFLKRAIDELKDKDLKKLEQYMQGPVGLITSDDDSFKLYNFLKRNRSIAAAKAGQIAPHDIIAPAGETDIPAGPILSELKMAGVAVKIEKGKIAIAKDSMLLKEGEEITQEKANVLSKLGIKPMKVGIQIKALLEQGTVYLPDVLDIDEDEFRADLQLIHTQALNLAVSSGYPCTESIKIMLSSVVQKARNLAFNANILCKETAPFILAKASAEANALKANLKNYD